LSPSATATDWGNVSVVIPTLNEGKVLLETLRVIRGLKPPPCQVLVVDGGSDDDTETIARQAGVEVLRCERTGRGVQMNLGARQRPGICCAFSMPTPNCPPMGSA
jgi:glycosyltransferase involved in cell wall biosynthesis